MYNAQLRLVGEGERAADTFVIAPESVLPIGRVSTDRARMTEVYEIGRREAVKAMPALMNFLTNQP